MSVTTVQAWHCDVCGHEWLKSEKAPIRCANPKCRARSWNQGFVEQAWKRAPAEAVAVVIAGGDPPVPMLKVGICRKCRGPLTEEICWNSQCVLFRAKQ